MIELSRRTVLKWLNALVVLVATPIAACQRAIAESFPTRSVEKDTFTFDPRKGTILWKQKNSTEPYALDVGGHIEAPLQLTYSELRKLPKTKTVRDFHCVEGWTVPRVEWSGFRFAELIKLVKPKEGAKYVAFYGIGETASRPGGQSRYVESFDVASLLDEGQDILLALDKDGQPLSHDRGAPLRVIAPLKLAYKSIKFVGRIEFTTEKKLGWWTLANPIYDWDAPVPASRMRPGRSG